MANINTQGDRVAYSIDEAAALLGIGRQGVYLAIHARRLEARVFGGRTLISRKAIQCFYDNLPEIDLSPKPTKRGPKSKRVVS